MNIKEIIHSVFPGIKIYVYDDRRKYIILSSFINEYDIIDSIEQTESRYVDYIVDKNNLCEFLLNNNMNNFFTIAVIDTTANQNISDSSMSANNIQNAAGMFVVNSDKDQENNCDVNAVDSVEKVILFYSKIEKTEEQIVRFADREDEIHNYVCYDDKNNKIIYKRRIIESRIFGMIETEHLEYCGKVYDVDCVIEVNNI